MVVMMTAIDKAMRLCFETLMAMTMARTISVMMMRRMITITLVSVVKVAMNVDSDDATCEVLLLLPSVL